MWPLRRRQSRAEPAPTRTPLQLTSESRVTTSVKSDRAWYIIDTATGAHLDSADSGQEITLPDGRQVTVTGHERPRTLTWRDPEPGPGITVSGGRLTLKGWNDASTTITLIHQVELPAGTTWKAVTTHQQLLDIRAQTHARAWVSRFARHGAATTGNT